MSLGYRYWAGIGVREDCMAALDWYQNAAEKGTPARSRLRTSLHCLRG